MRVIGVTGWSGAGKTTLIRRLIPRLVVDGLSVSTVKHAHHRFDVDQPGKDSWEHRHAGASQVLVASEVRWALMSELRGAPELGLAGLLARLDPVDLVLVEGYKRDTHLKIEVWRAANGKPPIFPNDPTIVALATDAAPPGASPPCSTWTISTASLDSSSPRPRPLWRSLPLHPATVGVAPREAAIGAAGPEAETDLDLRQIVRSGLHP